MVSKDEWDTKEGPGNSMKNALYVKWQGTFRVEMTSSSVKIKPVALAIVELHEPEDIKQAVS